MGQISIRETRRDGPRCTWPAVMASHTLHGEHPAFFSSIFRTEEVRRSDLCGFFLPDTCSLWAQTPSWRTTAGRSQPTSSTWTTGSCWSSSGWQRMTESARHLGFFTHLKAAAKLCRNRREREVCRGLRCSELPRLSWSCEREKEGGDLTSSKLTNGAAS